MGGAAEASAAGTGAAGSGRYGRMPFLIAPRRSIRRRWKKWLVSGIFTSSGGCRSCLRPSIQSYTALGSTIPSGPARIAQGKDTLHKHAIEGYTGAAGVMPAKGGNPALTDEQVIATVDWMLANLQ